MSTQSEPQTTDKPNYTATGMAIGMAIGSGLGVTMGIALGNMAFMAIFVGAGMSIGLAIGAGLQQSYEKQAAEGTQPEQDLPEP